MVTTLDPSLRVCTVSDALYSDVPMPAFTLPDLLVDILRAFRRTQLEIPLKLGAGKLQDDALLFAGLDGTLPSQKRHSKAVERFCRPDQDA